MSRTVRIALTLASTLVLSLAIGAALWWADWRFSRPTPRPATLVQSDRVADGVLAELRAAAGASLPWRPLVVHTFNATCPCSRFNREHVLELVREFGDRTEQLELVELEADRAIEPVHVDDDVELRALSENDGRIARALGVYSTPQAIVIEPDGHVYYRGNYNLARFCARADSAYARQALAALVSGAPCPPMPESARRSYGCELPNAAWTGGAP